MINRALLQDMPDSASIRIAPRPAYLDEFVIIDGTARVGKYLVGNLVAALERMEFVQEAVLLDHLLILTRVGNLDLETAGALLQAHLDLLAYYMMLGRNLNGRQSDLSAITNAPEPERFLARAQTPGDGELARRILEEQRLSLFVTHNVLCGARMLWTIFPHVKMVYVVRHPVTLIQSWLRRGYGARIGRDPSLFDLNFLREGRIMPWYALDWNDDYLSLPELERIVRSVATIFTEARREFEQADAAIRRRVLVGTFESIITDPRGFVDRVGRFLNRSPLPALDRIVARERLPRVPSDELVQARGAIAAGVSLEGRRLVDRLVAEYEDHWRPLATGGSPP